MAARTKLQAPDNGMLITAPMNWEVLFGRFAGNLDLQASGDQIWLDGPILASEVDLNALGLMPVCLRKKRLK